LRSTSSRDASPSAWLRRTRLAYRLLIPGEVFNRKIVDYLKFAREFNAQCPGFETDIHGLVEEEGPDGVRRYYADCVR
jgi:arginine decarboxylase